MTRPSGTTFLKRLAASDYWRHLWRAKWVILAITGGAFLLSSAGMLDRFETAGLDTFNILKSPADPKHVVIVGIDDHDYQYLFNSTSPLASAEVEKILKAIAAAQPRVIGVDLDTASKGFTGLQTPPSAPPIVWGRDAVWDDAKKQFTPLLVLGGSNPTRQMDVAAIAQFPIDSDGIIRRYRRTFPVSAGAPEPSFPWAVTEKACPPQNPMEGCAGVDPQEQSARGLVLNFAGQRFNFTPLSASVVLEAAAQPQWSINSPLRGRIVLLGGAYRAARDLYVTPVGPMQGVQLMAQAIETELSGGGIRPLNEAAAILLDLLSGAILVLISYRYHGRLGWALLMSLLALMVLPLVSSFFAFSTFARWFNFVPIAVGVLLHQFYEHAREYQRLRQQHFASKRAG
jgi:CHASE2 domain-containing sensor protein